MENSLMENSLIPCLPDDVVLNNVLTRVSWKCFFVLSALNKRWREEFRSGRVYEHRRRTKRGNQLVGIIHDNLECKNRYPEPPKCMLSVFTLPDGDAWLRLPPIPGVHRGFPQGCGFAFVDGRLYILGGTDDDNDPRDAGRSGDEQHSFQIPRSEVYEFDIAAGRGVWKASASMRRPRENFTCKVKDGKIHVAGHYLEDGVCKWETDVYDPQLNTWTRGVSGRFVSMHSAPYAPSGSKQWVLEKLFGVSEAYSQLTKEALNYFSCAGFQYLDDHNTETGIGPLISAKARVNGKLYGVSELGVCVRDSPSSGWRWQSTLFWDYLKRVGGRHIQCWCAVPVGGELLVVVSWIAWLNSEKNFALIISKGLSSEDHNITWNKLSFPEYFRWCRPQLGGEDWVPKIDESRSHSLFFNRCPPRVCASTV